MEAKRYSERLTPENAALLLIDHQVGLFTGVRDIPVAELKHNVVALAKAAKVLGVPIIVTATSPEMWGPIAGNTDRPLASGCGEFVMLRREPREDEFALVCLVTPPARRDRIAASCWSRWNPTGEADRQE